MTLRAIKHGTPAGYHLHRRRKSPTCDSCLEAWATYCRDRRRARRDGELGRVSVPLEVLGRLLIAAPIELEEWVEEQIGSTHVEVAISAANEYAAVTS